MQTSGDNLSSIETVLLYLLIRGRNAWQSTWSQHYQGPTSLGGTLDEAKRVAESWRTQGSTFYIHEIPALLLNGRQSAVVVADFRGRDPFGGWDTGRKQELASGEPLFSAAHALVRWHNFPLHRPLPPSVIVANPSTDDALQRLMPTQESRHWKSQSNGAGYKLKWIPKEGTYIAAGVRTIRLAHLCANREAIAAGATVRISVDDSK